MDGLIREPRAAVRELQSADVIGLDIETTGFSPWLDRIAVISMHARGRETAVIQTKTGEVPKDIADFMRTSNATFVTHNGTNFDMQFFANKGVFVNRHYDTLVGEYVLSTQGRKGLRKDLATTMKRRLGKVHKEDMPVHSWQGSLTAKQLSYAAADVMWLEDIMRKQETLAMQRRRLSTALQNEQMLTSLLIKIVNNGMALNEEVLTATRKKLIADTQEARERLGEEFGERFNVRSPKQVKEALASIGVDVPNTQVETLAIMAEDHQQIADILAVRKADKRDGFYDYEWASKFVFNGRVHASYWQVGTETTRFSASRPNLQQIPRDLRMVFGNEPGKMVVAADYAQIELRIAADLTNDQALVEALESEDIHMHMAQIMYNKKNPTKAERRNGKACTFTWLFGGGVRAVILNAAKYGIVIEPPEARQMLASVNRRFRQLASAKEEARALLSRTRPVIVPLPWGHERQLLPADQSDRKIINTRIQGTAAIGLKNAIFEMDEAGLLDYVGGLVHDEIVATSVPEKDAEEFGREMARCMRAGMEKVCTTVPIKIDVDVNPEWVP